MAVVLNKKNNVKLKIEAPMTSVSNLLIVDKGELLGDDFTSAETEKHFKGTLFKFDGENVSQIEISKVITKSGNFLTLERAVEPCPMNYSSNQMYQQAYDFEAGDWFYINLTAGDLEDIITELKATNTRIAGLQNTINSSIPTISEIKSGKYEKVNLSGTNIFTGSIQGGISSYDDIDGKVLCGYKTGATNTGSVTINLNNKGAKTLYKKGDVVLGAGDLKQYQEFLFVWNKAQDRFELVSPPAVSDLDINGLTALTAPAVGDYLPIYDISAASNKKVTLTYIRNLLVTNYLKGTVVSGSYSGSSAGTTYTIDHGHGRVPYCVIGVYYYASYTRLGFGTPSIAFEYQDSQYSSRYILFSASFTSTQMTLKVTNTNSYPGGVTFLLL